MGSTCRPAGGRNRQLGIVCGRPAALRGARRMSPVSRARVVLAGCDVPAGHIICYYFNSYLALSYKAKELI